MKTALTLISMGVISYLRANILENKHRSYQKLMSVRLQNTHDFTSA